MIRIPLVLSALILAGCSTPDLPDGPDGAPQWYDEQLDAASRGADAPGSIPSRPLDPEDDARRAESTEDVLRQRDALQAEERAQPVNAQTEEFADRERPRTTPPERED